MIVPNYVPDQLEVPGNVAEQPYPVRITFIRRVVALYVVSIAVAGGVSKIAEIFRNIWLSIGLLAAVLLGLEVWRILTRGRKIEAVVSTLALAVLLPVLGMAVANLRFEGWPVWQFLAPPLCVGLYTMLCGKDFSFVGCHLLSLIASTVAIAGLAMTLDLSHAQILFALASSVLYLTYLVYDLASLLSRRRVGEEAAAVTDLYRDIFNFFGYFVRVVRHWQRHRIWTVPEFDLPWKSNQ
jgi:hypothetical protein